MTTAEKLTKIKIQLDIGDTSIDTKLMDYLDSAEREILSWMYINRADVPDDAVMPKKYEIVQIQAVIEGFNHEGGEGEILHNENGINRTFAYAGMVDYIHAHVYHLV